MKKKYFSPYTDFKTGVISKLLLVTGFVLLLFTLTQKFLPFLNVTSKNTWDTIFAFSVLFLGVGIIMFFLSKIFGKIAALADEIENEKEED